MHDFVLWRMTDCSSDKEKLPRILGFKIYNHLNVACGLIFEPRETILTVQKFEGFGDCADRPSVMHVPPPVYPKRFPVITFDAKTSDHLDVTISGGLRAFEKFLDALNIPKKKLRQSEDDYYGELYYVSYVLHDKDVTDPVNEKFILKTLIPEGFQSCPVAATCRKELFGTCKIVSDEFFALDAVHRF